jgi:hypothetical protein
MPVTMMLSPLAGSPDRKEPERRTMEPETSNDVKDAGRRLQRWRLFLSEVRNELKRVS